MPLDLPDWLPKPTLQPVVMKVLTKHVSQLGLLFAKYPLYVAPFAAAGFLSIATYVVPVLLQNLILDHAHVNLKSKYSASWALVTGASSGECCLSTMME